MNIRWTPEELAAYQNKATLRNTKQRSKYGNVRTHINGIPFASKAEGLRYLELKQLESIGEISELNLQVSFPIEVVGLYGTWKVKYIADFVYLNSDGNRVVEDVKGQKKTTREYQMKKGLMAKLYGIEIIEVRRKREGSK